MLLLLLLLGLRLAMLQGRQGLAVGVWFKGLAV
jgi:hypothetical protein